MVSKAESDSLLSMDFMHSVTTVYIDVSDFQYSSNRAL